MEAVTGRAAPRAVQVTVITVPAGASFAIFSVPRASIVAMPGSELTLKEVLDSLVKTGEYKNVISEMGK